MKGTLVFEKAGTLDVEYQRRPDRRRPAPAAGGGTSIIIDRKRVMPGAKAGHDDVFRTETN